MTSDTGTPYGEWPSPITREMVATGGIGFGDIALEDDVAWWLERRPTENGRGVIVRRENDETTDVTPPDYNVRTLVHEYGGGDFVVHDDTVWFVAFDDQRLYRQRPGDDPTPITPEPAIERGDRYADMTITPDGERIYCVRERHAAGDDEATNTLITLPTDGSTDPMVVAEGCDFYSFPRVSPEGTALA